TSSICGGGRYDDLTGIFGLPGLSGVGISFGADRIYDVLNELNAYPESVATTTTLLFANFGGEDTSYALQLLQQVRRAGISAEIYPDAVKMDKQFKYADNKGVAFMAIVGENERKSQTVALKNLKTREQEQLTLEALIQKLNR
ncbi:MAG: His/Gly/Thr/Pro-type tRNA ligase C-terminal domain-containing protein, partial [Bacteroidia bacterium]